MATTENLINQSTQQPIPIMPPEHEDKSVPIIIEPEKQIELVNGKQEVKEMAGAKHSGVGTRIIIKLGIYLETNKLGRVYGPDATFTFGENERMPDVSFVSSSRIPPEGEPITKWEIAPDLAVEIVSPNDLFVKVRDKIREYFKAGVKQVWLITPQEKTITIYNTPTTSIVLSENETLTCNELLSGFSCPLSEIFIDP
jgi:Uma2 family endonuclease